MNLASNKVVLSKTRRWQNTVKIYSDIEDQLAEKTK